MSQTIWSTIDPASTSGTELAQILNDFKDAEVSGRSGTSRPVNLQAGGMWLDTTDSATFIWRLKIYDGADDITIFTINTQTNNVSIASADSLFAISRVTADSVGPILRLLKKRVANAGQILAGDTLGEIQIQGTTNGGVSNVQARLRVLATENATNTAQGSYLAFEVVQSGTTSLAEVVRIVDGKVGVGTQSPQDTLHAKGTGIRTERESDDSVGARVAHKKKRIAGTGQVTTNDVIGLTEYISSDDAGTERTVAQIEVMARQAQTSANQGSKVTIRNKNLNTNTFVDKIIIDDTVTIPTLSATTLNVTNLIAANAELGGVVNIDDASIILNDGGTQALANAAVSGIEIYMSDATHAKFGYDSTKASKFVIGEVGSLKEVVDVSSSQSLSNKSIIEPARSDVKQGLESDLITYANTASDGQWVFATDTQTMYQIISNSLVPAGAGGGGGGSLEWIEDSSAPMKEISFGFDIRNFDQGGGQSLFALIPVPLSYRQGKPIKLVGGLFFTPVTSGNVLFRTNTVLLDIGDVFGTFSNTRNSTNNFKIVSAPANKMLEVGEIDITDASGVINGISVEAGDMLRVEIKRDVANESGSAAADAKLLLSSFQLTFS